MTKESVARAEFLAGKEALEADAERADCIENGAAQNDEDAEVKNAKLEDDMARWELKFTRRVSHVNAPKVFLDI